MPKPSEQQVRKAALVVQDLGGREFTAHNIARWCLVSIDYARSTLTELKRRGHVEQVEGRLGYWRYTGNAYEN